MKYEYLNNLPKSTFLVTGGAGFIGSNLCEALLVAGQTVRCLDNFSTGSRQNIIHLLDHPNFTLAEGDIRDSQVCLSACQSMDYVLHQAAWGSVPRSIEMPQLYETINIAGTLNMMEAARQCQVKRFVYASSSSVYGDSPVLPKREGSEGKVLSPYALTKKVNEEYGRLYFDLYDLETIGLRYFNVFGRRQNPDGAYAAVIPRFVMQLLAGTRPTIHGDGHQSRDFTYIENVIEANLKACIAPAEAAGKAFNIGYDDRIDLIDVYEFIRDALDSSLEPVFGPERLGDVKHSRADISLARALLDYQPSWDFRQGITATVQWYKSQKKTD